MAHHPPINKDLAPADSTTPTPKPSWPELNDFQIEKAREAANGGKLFKYTNAGKTFLYTPITASSWQTLEQKWVNSKEDVTAAIQDEDICTLGVVWPNLGPGFWSSDEIEGGHPQSIATLIREYSGFTIPIENGRRLGVNCEISELEPDEEVPTPELTAEIIEELRPLSSSGQLFLVGFSGPFKIRPYDQFILRPIPRSIWNGLQNNQGNLEGLATEVCKFSVVWPKGTDVSSLPAGLTDHLFEETLKVSGFNAQPEVVEI